MSGNIPKRGAVSDTKDTEKRKLTECTSTVDSNLFQDWTGTYTSAVKDSGYCLGAGWAMTAAAQIESDVMRQHGSDYNYVLSAEQLLQCVTNSNGCSGGTTEYAFTYARTNGLELNNNYGYTSYWGTTGGPCAYDDSLGVAKVGGYFTTLAGDEGCMAHYVQNTGPLAVCLTASWAWFTYTGGIMTLSSCPAGDANHCVQAVGVHPSSSGGYWKLRNHASTRWGEAGFIRLEYGSNTCGLTNDPIFTSTVVDY